MEGGDIDKYVSKFEELVRCAGYRADSPMVINVFTKGLPRKLYEQCYTLDNPQSYEGWKAALLKRQEQYIHLQNHFNEGKKNLEKYRNHSGN